MKNKRNIAIPLESNMSRARKNRRMICVGAVVAGSQSGFPIVSTASDQQNRSTPNNGNGNDENSFQRKFLASERHFCNNRARRGT